MGRRRDPFKRDRILAAARRVFLASGYEKATMSGVASESGIAVGTLYLYFDSKGDLANALEEELFRRIELEVVPMFDLLSEPGGIERILHKVIEVTAEEAEILRMNNSGPGQNTPSRKKMQGTVAAALQREMDAGRIRASDPDTLSDLLITIIEQGLYQGLVYGDGYADMLAYKQVMIDVVRRAILP